MNKVLSFETSYRVSYPVVNAAGETTQHYVGWVKTDKSVKLGKDVKSITANQNKQMADLLSGGIEDLDPDAPSLDFYLATGAPGAEKTQFLGYFNANHPALASVITNMWPKLQFTLRDEA